MRSTRREFLGGIAAGAGLLAWEVGLEGVANAGQSDLPFPELVASGSAGTIGLAHGRRFAKEIKHNIGFYLRWFQDVIKLDAGQSLAVASGFEKVMREYTPALLEEIDGIAKGAKVKRSEILALNARTDMLVVGRSKRARGKKGHASLLAPRGEQSAEEASTTPGCTALALRGGSRKHPLLALGQNWDWRSDLAGNVVILRVKRRHTPRVVTFTEAGMVGKIGFNDRRLGVCLNFLSHKTEDPEGAYGVPVHVLLRAVMEARTLEEAYKLVAWAPRCASANFLMAQHDVRHGKAPEALDLEWTPTALARRPWSGAGLVHTNHFLDPVLAPGCDSGHGRSTMNRFARATLQAKALRGVGDPATRMQQILRDRVGAPYAVSKTAAKDSRSQTLAGIVMDLSRDRVHLCRGQPHVGHFVRRSGA
ncbi:MAG: hypothetical protein KAI47_10780 [Deltaproteobacteria bacterium]|nr:hypothetical protein [Deltaproteobacteria bacterium]